MDQRLANAYVRNCSLRIGLVDREPNLNQDLMR